MTIAIAAFLLTFLSTEASAQNISYESVDQTWQNVQKKLDNRGLGLSLRYDGEIFSDLSGGEQRGTTYLGNFNLQLNVDAKRLLRWPGATFFIYELAVHGGHPSNFVGDAQGVSNIEADAGWRIEEIWFQQNLFENRFSALIGRYDLNSEFYRLQSASLFLNSSLGIGPEFSQSGLEGPSIFPNTSFGARFAFKPSQNFVLRTAILDGVPVNRPNEERKILADGDGVLIVTEASYAHRPVGIHERRTRQFRVGRDCCGTYKTKVALGAWYYTTTFHELAKVSSDGLPIRHHGSRGFYALTDWRVYQDANNPDRQLNFFSQLGIGDARVSRFDFYAGGGMTISAVIPGRDRDELGIAIARAHNGSQFIESQQNQSLLVQSAEVAIELSYLAQFGEHLAVQPDLQFVKNPNTDPTIQNAVVFMLRFEVSI